MRMPATTWLAADTHTHLARLWLLLELDRQDMSASEQGRTRSKLRGTREGRALLVSAALSDWLRSAIGNHSNPGERIRSRPFHGRLSAPFLTPPRATLATFELVPQKALRGANRTSAVPVLPLVAVPLKCTIDPRRPTLSGRKGSLAVCGYDRRSCPTTTRTESSGEWRRKRKLLCEARKSEHALIVGSRSAQIGLTRHVEAPHVPSSRVPKLKRDHWIQRYHRNDSCGPRLDTEFAGRHGAKIV